MGIPVKLQAFEGPLDLLLHLIDKNKIDIYDLSLIHILTVGDEIMLDAGDYVPADGRIISCHALKVDESALTGESIPVEKGEGIIEGEAALGDRLNMVYSLSLIHI